VLSPTAEPKQNGVVGPDPGSLHSFASRITGDAGWHSPEFIMSCVKFVDGFRFELIIIRRKDIYVGVRMQ